MKTPSGEALAEADLYAPKRIFSDNRYPLARADQPVRVHMWADIDGPGSGRESVLVGRWRNSGLRDEGGQGGRGRRRGRQGWQACYLKKKKIVYSLVPRSSSNLMLAQKGVAPAVWGPST